MRRELQEQQNSRDTEAKKLPVENHDLETLNYVETLLQDSDCNVFTLFDIESNSYKPELDLCVMKLLNASVGVCRVSEVLVAVGEITSHCIEINSV